MTSPVRAPRSTPRRPEIAPVRELRPDLRVVPERGRRAPVRSRRTGAIVVAATAVVFASLLASAVFHSVLVGGQLHLDRVDRQIQVEREQLRRDQLALAQAQAPQRIAAQAEAQGMVQADEQTWISSSGGSPVSTGGAVDPDDGVSVEDEDVDPGTSAAGTGTDTDTDSSSAGTSDTSGAGDTGGGVQ